MKFFPTGCAGRIPFIDTRDIAAVAAVALTQPGHDGKKYALTGPEALSYADIARILSDVLGRPIAYHDLPLDDARERMTRAGVSPSAIDGSLALAVYQRAGGKTAIVHDTVRQVLGRPPRSFAAFVADHARFFNRGDFMASTDLRTVTVHGSAAGFAQAISIGQHRLAADEPVSVGGTDTGPNPYDLLLAALGSCTSMTVAMYARRKQWPLEDVTVRLRHSRVHAADCESAETKVGMLDHIDREVEFSGALSDEQRARLLDIANKCPVHRTLASEIIVRTRMAGL